TITAASCGGCTTLPTLTASTSPITNSLTDTGVAVGPGGQIKILTTTTALDTLKGTTSDQGTATALNTATTIQPPAPPAVQPPAVSSGPASAAPTLTDPTGTVGGDAGSFGGSGGGASGSGSAQGSGGGTQSKDSKPAKKANARC